MSDFDTSDNQTNLGTLTVCATSARWLSQSAHSAGFEVTSFDRFGDWDLLNHSVCHQVFQSKDQLKTLLKSAPPAGLLCGSGLETQLGILQEFADTDSWLNTSLESIHQARDPFAWSAHLQAQGFKTAELSATQPKVDLESWLCKHSESTGGLGVSFANQKPNSVDCFWQKFIPGQAISTLHVADTNSTHLLGVFLQLIGPRDSKTKGGCKKKLPIATSTAFGAKPFHFAGAIGPLDADKLQTIGAEPSHAERIAEAIVEHTGMRGVFGIDWILTHERKLVPIEINPRFTSTAELWERSTGKNIVSLHLAAKKATPVEVPGQGRSLGKAILFSIGEKFQVNQSLHEQLARLYLNSDVADVPNAGMQIDKGHPVVTLFENSGGELADITDNLEKLAVRLRRMIEDSRSD